MRGMPGTMDAWLTKVAIRPPRRIPACAVTSHSSRSRQANRVEAVVLSIPRLIHHKCTNDTKEIKRVQASRERKRLEYCDSMLLRSLARGSPSKKTSVVTHAAASAKQGL